MLRYETLTVDGSPMEVLIAEPDGTGPFPGIVMGIHMPAHAGLRQDKFTQGVAERYAANGYVCIAPQLFHRFPVELPVETKREGLNDAGIVADCAAAYRHLAAMPKVDGERIAILGHCMGGRVAWLAASHNPGYKAVGVFWGGGVKLARPEGGEPPIARAARIPCPVIGFFGNDDQSPSPADVDDYDAALTAAGVEHHFHRYDGAGHAFQNFTSEERYREVQAEDAWTRVLAFLDGELKREKAAAE